MKKMLAAAKIAVKKVVRKTARFQSYEVEIEVEIPVSAQNFDTFVLRSREKKVSLYLDHREKKWLLYGPVDIRPIAPSTPGGHKYRALGYRTFDLPPHFVRVVEDQKTKGVSPIRFRMEISQLTGEPAVV